MNRKAPGQCIKEQADAVQKCWAEESEQELNSVYGASWMKAFGQCGVTNQIDYLR